MENCIFCEIVKGDIPSTTIYEDKYTLAFLDITPVSRGHTLVIPKKHHQDIFDIPEDALNHIMVTVKKIAIALDKIADGINIGQNNKAAAGQDVFHIHFHVMPRYAGQDTFKLWEGKPYAEGDAEKTAAEIKNLL